jgi:hypothetical protein
VLAQIPNFPRAGEELLGDAEQMLFAGKIPADANWNNLSGVAILKTRSPYDREKVRQLLKGDTPQQLNGQTYYQLKEVAGLPIPPDVGGLAARPYVCMPSERVLVLAFVPPAQLSEVLPAPGARPRLPESTLALLRRVDKSQSWVVVPTKGWINQQLRKINPAHLARLPDLQGVVQPLQGAKAFWLMGEVLSNKKQRVTVGVDCADAAAATRMASAMKKFWDSRTVQGPLEQLDRMFDDPLGRNPFGKKRMSAIKAVIDEIKSSLEFTSEGNTALVVMEFSDETVERAQDEMKGMQGRNPMMPFGP